MSQFQFDAKNVDTTESEGFDPIPQGNHQMEVFDSEIKEADTGSVGLKLQYRITGESFNNRRIFDYINLKKKDGTENEIGHKQVAQLCNALGIEGFSDTSELHGITFTGYVGHDKRDGETRERIKGFKPAKVTPAQPHAGAEECPF